MIDDRFQMLANARQTARDARAAFGVYSSRAPALTRGSGRRAAFWRAAALAFAATFAASAWAVDGTATVTGGEVQYFGAASDPVWLNGTELLLTFTGEGSFILPGLSKARILAIGGGGGGAGVCSASSAMTTYFGGAGGGGAGGFVDVTNILSAATYAVAVGAGGAGGASASTHVAGRYTGTSGGDTTLSTNNIAVITAKGGGGGGGEAVGLNGGSGGGGSQYRVSSTSGEHRAGGSGVDGQGFAGGAGDLGLYGGGGGGAGGAGAAASTLNPVGGEGRPSDITTDDGSVVWYAGGGGGGFSDKSFTGVHEPIAGGQGGGSGGYGLNVSCTDATWYGGGGGGCGAVARNATTPGGSGYQGVVYVRIMVVTTGAIVKPVSQTVDFDGAEHVLVPANAAYKIVDLTDGSPTYGQVVERVAATAAGTYKAQVTLVDGFKWPDGTETVETVTLTINKATPVISDLRIRSWSVGTPPEATPNPSCRVSIDVEPTYVYGDSATGNDWSPEKPTTLGTHYLRAYIEESPSYNAAEAVVPFEIWNGPADVYRDYVEITVGAASSVAEDFVYTLRFAEGNPVGFLYSRAGDTGDDIYITDAAGNPLPFKVEDWNTFGTSTIYVRLTLATEPQVIRLFWCVRDGKTPQVHPLLVNDPSGDPQPAYDFDLVVRDGKRVNYWLLPYPSITPTKWDSNDPESERGKIESYGTVAEGYSTLLYVTNLNTGAVLPEITNVGGSFSAVFGPYDPAGDYETLEYGVDYFVVGHVTYGDLSGDYYGEEDGLTRNGRVLLGNDDSAPGGYAVKGQSYWMTDTSGTTYWTHSRSDDYSGAILFPYLQGSLAYLDHTLYTKDSEGNAVALWRLEDMYIGSTYSAGPSASDTGVYLPNSTTAKAISSETAKPGLAEQGTLVMRNKMGANVTSPVYTNGVGTIYFDAVNADNTDARAGIFKIKVEVSIDGGEWTAKPMQPFKSTGGAAFVADQTGTTNLTLEITAGGRADSFYRVAVPVDEEGTVQFRIVRTAINPGMIEKSFFILLDNILVSYPKSKASLEPYGEFDKSRYGRQTLGWAGAMSVPFPSVGDAVYARAKAIVVTNSNTHASSDMPITWAQMHYHWRYLDQETNAWQTINLRPTDGFSSIQPLEIPAREGDVEFWYDYIIQVPAYSYHDYSGTGLDLRGTDGYALYTEDVTASENTQMKVTGIAKLASGGNDWFFRLRRGASDWEGFKLLVKESEDGAVATNDMMLAGNHLWRGFCDTRKTLEGGLYMRVLGWNRQTPGSESYDLGIARFALGGDVAKLPATGNLAECATDDDWQWFTVPCDGSTGQLLLQLQDDTLAYTVVHADYQDFNGWTDANKKDGNGLFVGTSSDTNSPHMSGTSAEAAIYAADMAKWKATVSSDDYWRESFPATYAQLTANPPAYELYTPFSSRRSINTAFAVGPGQWVHSLYRWNGKNGSADTGDISYNPGMAFQMEGKGKGYIQFVDAAKSPRGLGYVTFKARVAQAIDFDDFCYYMTDPTSLANYTFATAAAFDANVRKNFAGNASLSVVALYTPGVGCYELRVEQEDATVSSTKVVTPGNTFRISLYRWAYDDDLEEVVATRLGTTTHANGSNMFNTSSEKGNYARLYISVDTSVAGETRVVGGVARTCVGNAYFHNSYSYRYVAFRDTDAISGGKRLKTGSFGVLSANCPARFAKPVYGTSPVTYPASATATTMQSNNQTIKPIASATECRNDIVAGKWKVRKARFEVNTDADWYGFKAVEPETTIDVYTAPKGTDDWKPLMSQTVKGFGSSSSAGATTTVPLYSLEEVSVRIAAGGSEKTGRKDVTIDDIEFAQWRGESYDSKDQSFDRLIYGSDTNTVFTQAWITKRGAAGSETTECLLSAKRAYADEAASIRSPRMVDLATNKGLGLGQLAFTYENAQSNAVLLVQIATNGVALSDMEEITKSVSPAIWTTVTNIDFSAMTPAERASGSYRCYFGLHGMQGLMRIALDPATVKAVEGITDPTAFGEVTITGIEFRDEPNLDKYSWWGWNLRTTDDAAMRSLADNAGDENKTGLSFALNNSVEDDIRTDVAKEQYEKKAPFLQTPTFATNLVNEVSFQARLYNTNDALAQVTLYGAVSGDLTDEASWTRLQTWDVTNTTFETYAKRFGAGNSFKAFRLAVTGVQGVTERMPGDEPAENVKRVLIDEVLVMEGIVAKVGFRNVGAFRMGLGDTTAATNVPSASQQPLCGEEWGVQCEVYASQLADEIDLSKARVRLWWYEDTSPWGFENWKDSDRAKKAWLTEAAETNLVFRSGYFGAPGAVMRAQKNPATVQYMLEVIYRADGAPQTNWLSSADWETPSWYAPLDYNADYGKGAFAAYTILDTVAPGWAWINEANIFGAFEGWNYDNTDKMLQFMEVAAPSEADLSEWSINFVEANINTGEIFTNEVARFGQAGLSGLKKGLVGMDPASKCVFHVIASPLARDSFSADDGRIDGVWNVPKNYRGSAFSSSGELNPSYPQSIQLVRPSGIVEHEVVLLGTNDYYEAGEEYRAENHVTFLNAHERGGRWFYGDTMMDSGGTPQYGGWSRSTGVFAGNGSSWMQWNNVNLMTPGRLNEGQEITGQAPKPFGSALVIYSIIDGAHLRQTFGEETNTTGSVTLIYRKGSEEATNITYRTDRWYEMGAVTVNGAPATPVKTANEREWTLAVGKATSNDVTVVASAQVEEELVGKYGLGPDNRYRDAVLQWLTNGKDAYGTAWHNPDATEFGLADWLEPSEADPPGKLTPMSLTEMYWLDIDPTWSDHDIALRVKWAGVPQPKSGPEGDLSCRIYMQITNSADGTAWAPYILQGCDFANSSWAYAEPDASWRWTNATFKITGFLPVDGLDVGSAEERNWIPLRWFVFAPDSFDENYTSYIELADPFSKASPGWKAGWYDWRQDNPDSSTRPVFRWGINDRSWPTSAEVMRKVNPW